MEFSSIRLHRLSCLAARGLGSLPDRSIDSFIFDAPYSEHTHEKVRRGGSVHTPDRADGGPKRPTISTSVVLGFDALTARTRTLVTRQCARLAKRWVIAFSDIESCHLWREAGEEAGLEYVRTGKWRKIGGTPQFTGDRPAIWGEVFTILHQPGRKRWNGGGKPAEYGVDVLDGEGFEKPFPDVEYAVQIVQSGRGKGQRLHTTQKPLPLMEALIRDFTDRGEVVCDPFAGSGTTGVAALRNGRQFIGYERDKKFHRLAAERLGLVREQLPLFPEAKEQGNGV